MLPDKDPRKVLPDGPAECPDAISDITRFRALQWMFHLAALISERSTELAENPGLWRRQKVRAKWIEKWQTEKKRTENNFRLLF